MPFSTRQIPKNQRNSIQAYLSKFNGDALKGTPLKVGQAVVLGTRTMTVSGVDANTSKLTLVTPQLSHICEGVELSQIQALAGGEIK